MAQSMSGEKLTRENIVRVAIDVCEDSTTTFSLRRVATSVPCDPMSISHHFGSRAGLERAMASWIDDRVHTPSEASPWRARLTSLAQEYRRVAQEYPRSFLLLQNFAYTGAADHRHSEVVHGALIDAGLRHEDVPTVTLGWFASIIGLLVAEIQGLVRPLTEAEIDQINELSDDSFPHWHRLRDEYRKIETDHVFQFTLTTLNEGIAAAAPTTPKPLRR